MDPDADPDPAIFFIDLQDANKKHIKKNSAYLLLFEGSYMYNCTSFINDKKSERIHRTVGITV